MKLRAFAPLILIAGGLAGCSALNASSDPQPAWNSSFGAAGSAISDAEANTAISVLVDNELGQALEPSDRKAAAEAQKRALRARGVGVSVAWQNDATGRSGQVRPGPLYQVNETACREFTHEMVLNGKVLTARGTACQEDNGTWETIS
ncbi:surface antigen [Roseibium hamelinense]|uniref:Surface antigen n=1 Tax=Roseibium hamelinense TaxID=150831 RepID=A0A562T886_9HYPH|nr:RT0821/Lpp0805 family surface protein [Roseibium hamelinense]MTI43716.1 hypothetical protein [Roseibium hamelinense]TWI89398.1 surface antigen [Roseibium hamelinense]